MNPKEFLQLTEAKLLTHLGEQLHEFFKDRTTLWTPWDEAQSNAGELKTLYQRVSEDSKFGIQVNDHQPLPPNLQKLLYLKREEMNAASAVQPLAQCNMVANVTFHLMAQQIAIVLHEMPELNKEKVLETSFENIKKLVVRYSKEIREEEKRNGKAHSEGLAAESTSHS